jgi:hypothetical protein
MLAENASTVFPLVEWSVAGMFMVWAVAFWSSEWFET